MPSAISRRDCLRLSAASLLGTSLSGWLDVLAVRAAAAQPKPIKSCILLYMNGGPSQTDIFDMKPDAAEEIRGEFKPIATNVPGIEITEHLPKLAQQMDKVALLRSMSTGEGGPVHAKGRKDVYIEPWTAGPRVRKPSLGAAISAGIGRADFGMPTHVVIGPQLFIDRSESGFFGAGHAPLHVADATKGIENVKPVVEMAAFDRRYTLMEELERGFAQKYRAPAVEAHMATYQNAVGVMHSEKPRAFELDREPASVRDAYGRTPFGNGCLLARRLVEVGMPFIEVAMEGDIRRQWDTHSDNFKNLKVLLPLLDKGMSALLADLKERGLLDQTLVVWMGEFGRTPKINPKGGGRDHFARAWTVAMAGAGLRTGQVVGRTTPDGERVADRPITARDLMATICQAVGVNPAMEFSARDGKPVGKDSLSQMSGQAVRLLDASANPVKEVLGA
jgi:hypothetical protein